VRAEAGGVARGAISVSGSKGRLGSIQLWASVWKRAALAGPSHQTRAGNLALRIALTQTHQGSGGSHTSRCFCRPPALSCQIRQG